MTLRRYEYYPASPESIRAAAGRVRGGSSKLTTLSQQVEHQHRAAVDVTHGELLGPLSRGFTGPYTLASIVSRRALWSAVQLEAFADAIEVYNRHSSDPWSIEKLNQTVGRGPDPYCRNSPGPDASPAERQDYARDVQEMEATIQRNLDEHFQRLEANLDAAAAQAARRLQSEPSDADIVAAWRAGNLPAYATLTWPELHLRSIPIDGIDEDLFGLTEQQIIDRLRDPSRTLSDAELEWLAVSYPDVMRRFHEEWTLENTVLLSPDQRPAGQDPWAGEHGWILGPDGRWYPVDIPEPTTPPPGEQVIGPTKGSLSYGGGSWVTLDSRQGPIYIGGGPPTGLLILSGALGYTPQIYGNPSIGENQTDYLTYGQDGAVYEHQQAPDVAPAWCPPPSVPDPELSDAPPGAWDPSTMDNPRLDRLNRASSLVDIGIGGLRGLQLSNQIDANNSYAGNVVFQASGDDRRVVIQLAQVKHDQETDEPAVVQSYAAAQDINQERSGDPEEEPTPTLRPGLKEPRPEPGPSPTPPG